MEQKLSPLPSEDQKEILVNVNDSCDGTCEEHKMFFERKVDEGTNRALAQHVGLTCGIKQPTQSSHVDFEKNEIYGQVESKENFEKLESVGKKSTSSRNSSPSSEKANDSFSKDGRDRNQILYSMRYACSNNSMDAYMLVSISFR